MEQHDLRAAVPDLIPYLQPGEIVVEVEDLSSEIKAQTSKFVSPLGALRMLNRTDSSLIHPVVASQSTASNAEVGHLHLFETVFGRDALIVAGFLRNRFPQMLLATLKTLAALQGVRSDQASEEEPGKIVHEARDPSDPKAVELTQTNGWSWPYYGAVDTTPLYVLELSHYATDDPSFLEETYFDKSGKEQTLLHSLKVALGWISNKQQQNPHGFVEYLHVHPQGLLNQFWEDSADSLSHDDGTLANLNQPIAALPVQLYTFDALRSAATLFRALKRDEEAAQLDDRATRLRQKILEIFWHEDISGGFFVAGLDQDQQGNYRQLRIKTVNSGFALNSMLLDPKNLDDIQRAEKIVRTLFAPDMHNVSGLRTLSSREKRYVPGGYHLGNVWLWTDEYVAKGLDRHGYHGLANRLREELCGVVDKFKKFPEYAKGDDESEPMLSERRVVTYSEDFPTPTHRNPLEQPPQEIQAWTVAAYETAKEALQRRETTTDPERLRVEDELLRSN